MRHWNLGGIVNDGRAGRKEVVVDSKAIFSREVLLDLIGRYIHTENGNSRATVISPRFQQLDAVRKLIADARRRGPGHNYLIQHSAGSGKSLTIGWLAHQIINVHDDNDRPVFNTAIIITDRIVLDRQLQRTISELEQTPGVVRKIDGTSRQLREAIEAGARIIVTTIQKFSTDHLREISGQRQRNFAIIVDEAHSSQSGKSAKALNVNPKVYQRDGEKVYHLRRHVSVRRSRIVRGAEGLPESIAVPVHDENVGLVG